MPLMKNAKRRVRASHDADRKAHPYRYVDTRTSEVFYIENVAQFLGCSVDHVRRIPRHELPAAKVGQRLQYLREDVVKLVKARRNTGKRLGINATHGELQKSAVRSGTYDPTAHLKGALPRNSRR